MSKEPEIPKAVKFQSLVAELRGLSEELSEFEGDVKIPQNESGVEMGTYSHEEIGDMLYFIADMLE